MTQSPSKKKKAEPAAAAASEGPRLKIAILSRDRTLYSTSSLVEACKRRGHEVRVIDYLRCHMNITSHRPTIYLGDEELSGYDAIIPRIGASHTFFGCAVVRQFEMMRVYSVNESVAISRSRDKLRSLQLLARQGVGVVLAETRKAAESVIEAFRGLNANILAQEFIAEAGGADLRCFVIGERVVAAIKRQAKEGEFRSNLHRGGSATIVKITPEERSTAVRAAKILGLNVAGVDLLRSNHGPVVMEVNSSPGLEGIETATGKDIAGQIVEFIEKNAAAGKTRTRGAG